MIVLGYLTFLSYLDIRYRLISNRYIVVLFVPAIVIGIWLNWLSVVLFTILMSLLALILWYKGIIGGADTKLLIALAPVLSFNSEIFTFIIFILLFGILSSIYGVIYKKISKKEMPLIPIIALTYGLTLIFNEA